jgi:hypothetical protein
MAGVGGQCLRYEELVRDIEHLGDGAERCPAIDLEGVDQPTVELIEQ